MIRSWECGIKSKRIVEDIQKLTWSINEIIKKEGAVVHFEGQRTGRRRQQHVHKVVGIRSQREGRSKAAIKRFLDWPLHPNAFDALEERRAFLKVKRTAAAAIIAAVLAVANEALDAEDEIEEELPESDSEDSDSDLESDSGSELESSSGSSSSEEDEDEDESSGDDY